MCCFFFFKQKTAYEMRISDWSSDVCSSDLVRHHPAIPYEEMPDFMRQLRGRAAIAARALELTVLCATRTNETLKMKWSEVNLQTEGWTVPKERMKMNVEHSIPLPPRAVEIIKERVRGEIGRGAGRERECR